MFDVVPTLAPTSFDALIIDVPYSSGGLRIGTKQQSTRRKYQGSGVQHRRQDFDGDSRDQVSFQAWATDVLRAGYWLLKRSAVFAAFSDWRQIGPMAIAAQCAGFVLRGIAVWDKTEAARPSPGRFRNQCEFVLWGSKGELPADRGVPILPGVLRHVVRVSDKHTGRPPARRRTQPAPHRVRDPSPGRARWSRIDAAATATVAGRGGCTAGHVRRPLGDAGPRPARPREHSRRPARPACAAPSARYPAQLVRAQPAQPLAARSR
ncbi:MAG: site-specific DNA-methyltransferase [Myxococcales bacterium]|nr:site-specific DNA-methyltransferase [Myxococcales bacterium]